MNTDRETHCLIDAVSIISSKQKSSQADRIPQNKKILLYPLFIKTDPI
jgi:hypothetical protein